LKQKLDTALWTGDDDKQVTCWSVLKKYKPLFTINGYRFIGDKAKNI